jgi:diaminohydroxyphosphoribosylaminopyrimidine deaminase/5-amino-6-(5-phosphoribosylamino)uracil reductase
VVVGADGKVVGRGWHRRAGEAHAEVAALKEAGTSARGATLFVTLEPCNHTGRTGPCTEAILKAGIARVVIGARDPNPRVEGGGAPHLERHGVSVDVGVCGDEALWLIRFFAHHMRHGRPWVIAKTATSLDGRVATASGESQWITGEDARRHAHGVRAYVDAILVGVGTVAADNPRLTARVDATRQPVRVVLDASGRTPPDAAVLGPGTLVLTTERMSGEVRHRLERAGCEVHRCPATPDGRVSIPDALMLLGNKDIQSLLVEGGPTVLGSFVDAGHVDEWHAYVAPMVIGGAGAPPSVAGRGSEQLRLAPRLRESSVERLGADLLIHGTITDWRN